VRTRFQEFSLPRTRVPHISLVFREMWDSADSISRLRIELPRLRNVKNVELSSVVSHISRKTSEIWGTRVRDREES
jgi:hypothetical protein